MTGLLLWDSTVPCIAIVRTGLRIVVSCPLKVSLPHTELYPVGAAENVVIFSATEDSEIRSTVHKVVDLTLVERFNRFLPSGTLAGCKSVWGEYSHIVDRVWSRIVETDRVGVSESRNTAFQIDSACNGLALVEYRNIDTQWGAFIDRIGHITHDTKPCAFIDREVVMAVLPHEVGEYCVGDCSGERQCLKNTQPHGLSLVGLLRILGGLYGVGGTQPAALGSWVSLASYLIFAYGLVSPSLKH